MRADDESSGKDQSEETRKKKELKENPALGKDSDAEHPDAGLPEWGDSGEDPAKRPKRKKKKHSKFLRSHEREYKRLQKQERKEQR